MKMTPDEVLAIITDSKYKNIVAGVGLPYDQLPESFVECDRLYIIDWGEIVETSNTNLRSWAEKIISKILKHDLTVMFCGITFENIPKDLRLKLTWVRL